MSNLRMTSDLRRQLILGAAKRCFARNGFAGTTTKSVAAAAAISEGLLFKHFPSKAALYAEILAEECEADPDLAHLLGPGAVDRDAGRTGQGHGRAFPADLRRARRGGGAAPAADGQQAISTTASLPGCSTPSSTSLIGLGIHRLARERHRGRRCVADRRRAAQPVLVRPSHRADGRADAAARRFPASTTAMPPVSNGSCASSSSAASDLTKPQLLPIWTARCRRTPGQSVAAESA